MMQDNRCVQKVILLLLWCRGSPYNLFRSISTSPEAIPKWSLFSLIWRWFEADVVVMRLYCSAHTGNVMSSCVGGAAERPWSIYIFVCILALRKLRVLTGIDCGLPVDIRWPVNTWLWMAVLEAYSVSQCYNYIPPDGLPLLIVMISIILYIGRIIVTCNYDHNYCACIFCLCKHTLQCCCNYIITTMGTYTGARVFCWLFYILASIHWVRPMLIWPAVLSSHACCE